MKNFIKRFTAVLSAVLIFCISVVPSSVSAYTTVSFEIPFNFYNNSSLDDSTVKTIFDNIYNNQSIIDLGYSSENSTLCIYEADGTIKIYIQKTDFFVNVGSGCILNFGNDGYPKYIYYSFSNNSSSISDLLYYSFSLTSISYPGSGYRTYNLPVFDSNNNQYFIACINSNYYYGHNLSLMNGYSDSNPDISKPLAFFYNYVPSASKPDVSDKLTFTGVRLGVDKKGFLEWLISEGKESVINSTGFNFTQKQLSLLVDVFDSYGNSSFWFYSSLVKTFKLTQHSLSGASALLSTLQELYRDYLDYKNSIEIVEITPDDSAKPHWRQDKTDNSLVTDHDDDTSVVSILREILRTLIYLPSSIRTSFSDLATNIVSIIYNWNRLFDYLNNLEFPSVEIPDNTSFLEYLFKPTFSDFDNLEAEVKEKFPLLSQIEAVPDPDDVIIESNQIVSYASTSGDPDQPVLPSFEAENIYNNDFLFSFEVPEDSSFLNGSITGVKVPFASFSKLLPAIEAFKGIISVIAIAAFSNWLIKFAPKLMHGYSSGD